MQDDPQGLGVGNGHRASATPPPRPPRYSEGSQLPGFQAQPQASRLRDPCQKPPFPRLRNRDGLCLFMALLGVPTTKEPTGPPQLNVFRLASTAARAVPGAPQTRVPASQTDLTTGPLRNKDETSSFPAHGCSQPLPS